MYTWATCGALAGKTCQFLHSAYFEDEGNCKALEEDLSL